VLSLIENQKKNYLNEYNRYLEEKLKDVIGYQMDYIQLRVFREMLTLNDIVFKVRSILYTCSQMPQAAQVPLPNNPGVYSTSYNVHSFYRGNSCEVVKHKCMKIYVPNTINRYYRLKELIIRLNKVESKTYFDHKTTWLAMISMQSIKYELENFYSITGFFDVKGDKYTLLKQKKLQLINSIDSKSRELQIKLSDIVLVDNKTYLLKDIIAEKRLKISNLKDYNNKLKIKES